MFHAEVLADSIYKGSRLVTFTATFPRSILTEFYTHALDPVCVRKNLSSSRAIPTTKLVDMVVTQPFVPNFALNKSGMQAGNLLEEKDLRDAEAMWESHKNTTVQVVKDYQDLKVHKQYVNRLMEPWMWCTAIITATDWANFFAQRYHSKAEPSFQRIARMMWEAMENSTPYALELNEWHLPLANDEETRQEIMKSISVLGNKKFRQNECLIIAKKVSAARCARISYLTHEGKRDILEDLKLFEFLVTNDPGHWSPLEHVLTPAKFEEMSWKPNQIEWVPGQKAAFYRDVDRPGYLRAKHGESGYCGAYKGWKPFRHEFSTEMHTTFTPPEED